MNSSKLGLGHSGPIFVCSSVVFLASVLMFPAAAICQNTPTPSPAPATPVTTSGGGVAGIAASNFRMVSATSGSKSVERNGKFIIEDPRAQFRAGEDHKVIVYFNWSGPVGPHDFEGLWRDPSGKVVVVSDFKYEPRVSPFSGYWTMLLDDNASVGFWSVDARIDGQSAGTYSFEVISGPLTVPVPPAPIPPTPAEIYRQADAATVSVESLAPSGKLLNRSSGFFIAPDRVLTTFGGIDGAASLRIARSDGASLTTNQVDGWNRWQDWALLVIAPQQVVPLKPASGKSGEVGERCYSLGVAPGGARTISQETIVGNSDHPPAGPRLNLALAYSFAAAGGPVLDEFGNLIGMLGGSTVPGTGGAASWSGGIPPLPEAASTTAFVVPIAVVNSSGAAPLTLKELANKGEFIPPLTDKVVLFGTITNQLNKVHGSTSPRNWTGELSKSDMKGFVFIHWNFPGKLTSVASLRIYDLDNKLIVQSASATTEPAAASGSSTYWTLQLASFPPGTYRADVYFGEVPVWREFFRITP